MMAKLLKRGDELARAGEERALDGVVQRLTSLLRGLSIEIEETHVLVSGRGLLKRWLTDPDLRFLNGDRR
jgi:hypothetical protein